MQNQLLSKTPSKKYIEIKSVTWTKDSHGLFDYESKNLTVKKLEISNSCKIYRDGAEITMIEDTNKDEQRSQTQLQYLSSISVAQEDSNRKFFINPQGDPKNSASPVSSQQNKPNNEETFLIVRSFKNKDGQPKGYGLEAGDIIKLGRIEYAVLEIRSENLETQSIIPNLFCQESKYKFKSNDRMANLNNSSIKKTCKICLEDTCASDTGDDSILISPCDCKGSCEFVHFVCLKNWLESKIVRKQNGNTSCFQWKKLECEVCKAPLPKKIFIDEKSYDLIDIVRPPCPYIVLECISRERKASKGIYLINAVQDDQIKLGRGHQCNLRISDISVSRLHAYIKYENGKFLIYDNNSKFGTLVLMKNSFSLMNDKMAIQIGRTVISFAVKTNSLMSHQAKPVVGTLEGIPQHLQQFQKIQQGTVDFSQSSVGSHNTIFHAANKFRQLPQTLNSQGGSHLQKNKNQIGGIQLLSGKTYNFSSNDDQDYILQESDLIRDDETENQRVFQQLFPGENLQNKINVEEDDNNDSENMQNSDDQKMLDEQEQN